jgi:oxygen-independent coproporphyrinogen III oxidase
MSGTERAEGPHHLYVHVPFCPVKCEYCAFVTHIGSLKNAPAYVDALCRELRGLAAARPGGPLDTLYFGGGTPSLLEPAQISNVIDAARSDFGLSPDAEVTLECHPATVTTERLEMFQRAGVTRVSFGAESMHPRELIALGRTHQPDDVARAVASARQAGLSSVALDLMYGIPRQTLSSWTESLQTVLALGVDHLSLYPLQLEARTVFHRRHRRGELTLPDDEIVVEMYLRACEVVRAAGFEHYEVSNWARAGHACRHNTAYWRNAEFYAIGAGAHGYLHPYRTENIAHTNRYIDAVLSGREPVAHREGIDQRTRAEETMMLGLRLLHSGPDLDRVATDLGDDPLALFAADISRLRKSGLLSLRAGRLTLPERAVPIANEVWESFVSG